MGGESERERERERFVLMYEKNVQCWPTFMLSEWRENTRENQ